MVEAEDEYVDQGMLNHNDRLGLVTAESKGPPRTVDDGSCTCADEPMQNHCADRERNSEDRRDGLNHSKRANLVVQKQLQTLRAQLLEKRN